MAVRKLLAASGRGVVRLHDIVFQATETVIVADLEAEGRFRDRLDKLIADEDETRSHVTQRVARRHEELLVREHRKKHTPAVLYGLARNRSFYALVPEFGELLNLAQTLTTGAATRIELRAIIEAIEATYNLTAAHKSNEAAPARLEPLLPAFSALESAAASDEMRREVRHHRAKMLVRLEQPEDAEKEFRRLLGEDPEMHAAKLQLVRLLSKRDPHASTGLARELVDADSGVPSTVRVAAWAELARLDAAWVAEHVDGVLAALRLLDHGDVTAAYDLVGSLGSKLAYGFPNAALAVFDAMGDGDECSARRTLVSTGPEPASQPRRRSATILSNDENF